MPGGAAKEEGVHQRLAVVAVPREALVEGGADEREEKQREHGEGVAEPCVGVSGRAVREREGDVERLALLANACVERAA